MTTVEAERPLTLYKRPIDFPPLEPSEIPDNVRRLSQYVHSVAIPRGDLRRGQVEALEETVRFLENGGRSAYVEQASGYGKSRLMEEIGKGYGGKQVYITDGEEGSNNIFQKLSGKMDLGRVDTIHKGFGHKVTIITMQMLETLTREASRGKESRTPKLQSVLRADLVFADEVHHYLTPGRLFILASFLHMNPRSIMLGATATEGYNSIKNAEQQFGKCLHRVSLSEGVDEGVLISPHVVFVRTGASLNNSRVDPKGNIVFDSSVPVDQRDRMLLEAYLRSCREEGRQLRTISYLSTKEHAYNFAELAESMGIPADVIVDGVHDRNAIYDRLREGELATVATVETAIESLDLPWLEGIIVSAQTKSLRVAYQMFPRPMRNLPGKSAPYIWQAVDNKTLYKNRPVLAADILGVERFVNGSVVTPRKIEGDRRTDFDLGSSGVSQAEIILPEGVEVDVEVINIHSLFRMGILDRAELLGKGLLPPQEVEKLRTAINDFSERYKGRTPSRFVNTFTISGVNLYDEEAETTLSLSSVIARIFGISTASLRDVHLSTFKGFLSTGKLSLPQTEAKPQEIELINGSVESKTVPSEEVLQRIKFKDLCERFRNGELSEEEKRNLSFYVYDRLKGLDPYYLSRGPAVLAGRRINHPAFVGTVRLLSRWLGFSIPRGGTSYREFNFLYDSYVRLIDFANKYQNDQQIIGRKRKAKSKSNQVRENVTPQLTADDIELIRNIFKSASSKGLNIRDVVAMNAFFGVIDSRSSGRLSTLTRRIGIENKRGYLQSLDLDVLLKLAGLEE